LRNHCCHGKAISISYSECESLALAIQHAKRMHYIILSSVACPALPHFSALSHKLHDFVKKVIEITMCVLIFFLTFVRNIFHSKNNSVEYYHKFGNRGSTVVKMLCYKSEGRWFDPS